MSKDEFLEQCCDEMDAKGIVITPESLVEYQNQYDLETCRQWIEDNQNG